MLQLPLLVRQMEVLEEKATLLNLTHLQKNPLEDKHEIALRFMYTYYQLTI